MSTTSTRGVGYTKHLDLTQTREVYESPIQNWNFLYESSTTLPTGYNVGDRVITPDGRVFRLAKATNIIANIQQGVKFYNLQSDGVGYKAATASAIGDTDVTIDAGDAGDYTLDQLRGGYVIIHTHGDLNHQFRGIVGNSVSDSSGNVTLYLDGPLTHTLTASHGVEVHTNPYNNVRQCNSTTGKPGDKYTSVAGLPNKSTTVANEYVWIQTWGFCWCNPHGASLQDAGVSTDERRVVFDWEGSISIQEDCIGATDDHQAAGFLVNRCTASVAGSGFIMLQISI